MIHPIMIVFEYTVPSAMPIHIYSIRTPGSVSIFAVDGYNVIYLQPFCYHTALVVCFLENLRDIGNRSNYKLFGVDFPLKNSV